MITSSICQCNTFGKPARSHYYVCRENLLDKSFKKQLTDVLHKEVKKGNNLLVVIPCNSNKIAISFQFYHEFVSVRSCGLYSEENSEFFKVILKVTKIVF